MAVADHLAAILRSITTYGEPIMVNGVVLGDYDADVLGYPDAEDLVDIPLTAFLAPLDIGENPSVSATMTAATAYIAAAQVPSGLVFRAGQFVTRGDKQFRIEDPVKVHGAGGVTLMYELTLHGTDEGLVD